MPAGDVTPSPTPTRPTAKPRRSRTTTASTTTLANAQISAETRLELDGLNASLQDMASKLRGFQGRIDAWDRAVATQYAETQDSLDSLKGSKADFKASRAELEKTNAEVYQLRKELGPLLRALVGFRDTVAPRLPEIDNLVQFREAALPRLAELAEVKDFCHEILLPRVAALEGDRDVDDRQGKRARQTGPDTATPLSSLLVAPPAPSLTLEGPVVVSQPVNTSIMAPAVTAAAATVHSPAMVPFTAPALPPAVPTQGIPTAHVLPSAMAFVQPAGYQSPASTHPTVTYPTAGLQPTSFLPSSVTTRGGVRRNFYFKMGPLNTAGARPLDVITSLLKLLPNNALFASLVKDAALHPTDFTYVVGTCWQYSAAAGIVTAWTTTRPPTHTQIVAELVQGN